MDRRLAALAFYYQYLANSVIYKAQFVVKFQGKLQLGAYFYMHLR